MKARTIALAIALLCANPIAHAQKAPASPIFAPNELIFGMTYGDWTAAWWQFYLQIPNVNNNHPFLANADDGACHNGTQLTDTNKPVAPVYFLAGVFSTTPVKRTCTVPAGSPILFAVTNAEFSNLEVENAGVADLREVTFQSLVPFAANFSSASVSLDGASIGSLTQFRFESPAFSFTAPSPISNFIFYTRTVSPSNSSSPISVSDGFWIAIKPLPVGQHTLTFSGPPCPPSACPPNGAPGINNVYTLNVQ